MIKRILALLVAVTLIFAACTTSEPEKPAEPEVTQPTESEIPAEIPDLEAAGWKPYDENGNIKRTDRDGNGENGVVSTGKYEASVIGAEIIADGGNAIDAAVAVGFALGVCEPQSSGLGGGGFMLIHVAETGENIFIDFRERAPEAASPAMWEVDENGDVVDGSKEFGGKASGVPGEVKGLLYALDNYGTMERSQVMAPAIDMATNGFEVSAVLNRDILDNFDLLNEYPEIGAIYLNDGFPFEVGETLTNPELAATLQTISDEGESAFYTGPIAQSIVASNNKYDGLLTMEDLAGYDVMLRDPLVGEYRGYEIVAAPPPSSGGITVVQILNILENYDIAGMDMDSPEYYHLFSEAFKLAFADRGAYIGDPAFVDVPIAGLIDKDYAVGLSEQIDPDLAKNYEPGNPSIIESEDTTHYSIMDKDGNIVAVTKTINGVFASGVVPEGRGFILNNEMDDFDAGTEGVNTVEPKKTPLSSMSPTIILKDGKPVMTIGAPGSQRIITGVAQVISKYIDHDMDIQDAISAPRIHDGSDYSGKGNTLIVESRLGEDVIQDLRDKGHLIVVDGDYLEYPCVQAVVMLEDGTLRGGADPRRDGKAVGY